MKIVYDDKDVKEILIAHAQTMGIECNAIDINASYNSVRTIEVYWDADLEVEAPTPAPVMFAHPLHNHIVRAEVATEF